LKLEFVKPARPAIELKDLLQLRLSLALKNWPAPSLMMNLVSNTSGEFVSKAGTSRALSNDLDRQAIIAYRTAADCVLVSAKTARAEGYTHTKTAPLVIASSKGDFSGIPAVENAPESSDFLPVYLLAPKREIKRLLPSSDKPWIRYLQVSKFSPRAIIWRLTRNNFRRVLVEAGPSFCAWLIQNYGASFLSLTVIDSDVTDPNLLSELALQKLGIFQAELEWADRVEDTTFMRFGALHPVK
jgi:riboflavin biosynthesis pyrimidine reductase